MGSAGETCRNGDFRDGQTGPTQQLAGFCQARVATERPGAAARPGTGLPVQPARAHAGNPARIGARQRAGDMVFHGLHDGRHGERAGPAALPGGTRFSMHEPVADFPREVRAAMPGDRGVHHVRWRRPGGAGDAVPVRHMQPTFQEVSGVTLRQADGVFPVRRRPPFSMTPALARTAGPAGIQPCRARERTTTLTRRTRLRNRAFERLKVNPDRTVPMNMTGRNRCPRPDNDVTSGCCGIPGQV